MTAVESNAPVAPTSPPPSTIYTQVTPSATHSVLWASTSTKHTPTTANYAIATASAALSHQPTAPKTTAANPTYTMTTPPILVY